MRGEHAVARDEHRGLGRIDDGAHAAVARARDSCRRLHGPRGFGCIAGVHIGSAMAAPVEGWPWQRIQDEHGTLERFLPYHHYRATTDWVREPGTTEDGVEHVLLLEPRGDDAFAGVYEPGTTLRVRRVDVEGTEFFSAADALTLVLPNL